MIRKIAFNIAVVFVGIVVVSFFGVNILLYRIDEQRKPYDTYVAMVFTARGCEDYEATGGQWPTSVTQSLDSKYGVSKVKDAWGNDFIFVPYEKENGYGELISYGRDGKPGGSGLDRDWILRYPIRANYVWDKGQAMDAVNFRNAYWTNYNWFDSSLSEADRPTTNDSTTNAVFRKK